MILNFQSTMITEWDLVCEDKWMKTFAKLLLFSGKVWKIKLTQLILWKYESESGQGNGKHKLDEHLLSHCSFFISLSDVVSSLARPPGGCYIIKLD